MLLFTLILSIIALVLVVGLIAYLKYLNFTFYLDHQKNEFVIQEGIFNKTKTTVQLYKIQQVNITQNLLQRAINVYSIEVDTAGSNDKEGKIKAISHDLALELKAALLQIESKVLSTDATTNATRVGSTSLDALVMLVNSNRPLVQLTITGGMGTNESVNSTFKLYPNPTKDILFLTSEKNITKYIMY